jgi:phosphate-selective porin OprO/OprP
MRSITLVAAAIGSTCWTVPALAQSDETSGIEAELAAMRAQMAEMAARMEALEGELTATKAEAAAASEQAGVAVASAAAAEENAQAGTEIVWKGAPEFSGEGGWSFKPRGRIQVDAGAVNAPDSASYEDGFGSEIRRARLGVEGDVPGGFGYKFEIDFAGNAVEVADALLSYSDGGLKLTAGHQNNFQSLEELTSSLHTSFIERAAFTDAFGFERRVGASVEYAGKAVLVQAGLFSDNIADLPDDRAWSADGRVVFFPKVGSAQLHLGGSIHYTGREAGSTVRYRQRPFVHFNGTRFVNTGAMTADSETGYGLEAAGIFGRFHATGEAFWQHADLPGMAIDPTFFGAYAEAGFFLTPGDRRGYKGGKFDRVKPRNPLNKGGMGALQINLRYDHLDLVDAGIVGGVQDSYAVSLVWTPTDYTRFLINYARNQIDQSIFPVAGGDTSYAVDAVGVRAQVDF